jgi:dihydrolipoamide dehydrogenase
MSTYDVVVIGSGPGGYVAAIRAAHNGLKVALVEKDGRLGGTCLLRGCIPTKSLLHSADLLTEMKEAKAFGINAGEIQVDFAAVQKARDKVVVKSAAGVAYLMKQNKIDVLGGVGRLKDEHTVLVVGKESTASVTAKSIILATGSVPKQLPMLKVDGRQIVTSDELLVIPAPPRSLLVLGAGAVGVEFASIFSRFGSETTIVEMLDHVLPIEDEEISVEMEKLLRKRGITLHIKTRVEKAEVKDGQVSVTVAGPDSAQTLSAEVVLVATGRGPFTEGLGLEAVGLKTNKGGFVETNALMQTAVPNIYAIGDIVPTPQLAHVASHEAILAADHIAQKHVTPINYLHVPSCTYSDPEVASVGLSEKRARANGRDIKVGKFPFAALGKARVMGKNDGFVKVVADKKYDELLGVHIIGPRATDLIAEAVVALAHEATALSLAHTMHAHPTLPEAVMEAALGAVSRPLHL